MPREKLREEEAISNEEEEFLTMELEELPEEVEEDISPRFSLKQKLILVGLGVFFFLFFSFLLFPYENIVRSAINSGPGGPSSLSFRELKVSIIFGEISAKSLEINGPSVRAKANEASIQAGLISLLRKKINGEFRISGIKLDYDGNPLGTIDSLKGFLKLDSIALPASRQSGSFQIGMPSGSRGFLPGLPELPVLDKLENFRINKLSLKSRLNQGNLDIDEFVLDTSIARFDITGNIRLSDSLGFSQLNLKVCLELERNFALEREDIVGMLALLEKSGGGKCLPITGILQKPEVKIPGLNGGPPGAPPIGPTP
ncbi:type II secretion system protein N [Leptospira fainei serovar Hurstbridge str. BUT 6]|uniref:Type II secretion system protein N n=1 Tax=Leptospira fainei serovar Hurstbridge str. BUT 6 TaxID=1193011 RepID=S3V5M9_9LEPT|nr:type II secretion system protein GspN [Leptospira fainei]EPG75944.1 type II secretion system protein N [Leptospira fainei serovar Hurstbridge str. BUT 6]